MAKTLQQLRVEVAARLGFGAQGGADIVQAPLLNSLLQRSQEEIIQEFGTSLPGTITPANPFTLDSHYPSVPETPLLLRTMRYAKGHYNRPDAALANEEWNNWERNVRMGIG